MYDKILTQLKQKHPGVSKRALEAIAKKLAGKVTEETTIEGAITEFDNVIGVQDFANALQSEGDLRVTEATKKPKAEEPPKPQPQQQPADDEPEWAKRLFKTVSELTAKTQRETMQDKLNKLLSDKKIPLSMAKGRIPEKEEDIDTVLAEIEADYTEIRQGAINQTVKENTVTVIGGNSKPETIDAEIAAWSKAQQPEKGQQQSQTKN